MKNKPRHCDKLHRYYRESRKHYRIFAEPREHTLVFFGKSGDASADKKVKPFKSAAIVAKPIKTVYAENGEDYADIDEAENKVTLICFGGKRYAIQESTKSESGVYTAKVTDALIFEVTVTDGKAQITQKAAENQEAA